MSMGYGNLPAVNSPRAGWSRIHRFVPPTVNSLQPDAEHEAAAAIEAARANGLAEGHAQGWSEGRESGLREGEAKARQELLQPIAALEQDLAAARASRAASETLEQLLAARDADRAALEADCRCAIAAALRVLYPALLTQALGGEIAAVVTDALAVRQADRIVVRAHPHTLAAPLLRDISAAAPDRLALHWDDTIGLGAVEVVWANGGMVADWDALLARILAVLGGGAASAHHVTRPEEA